MTAPTRAADWSSAANEPAGEQALYRFLIDSLTEYAVFAVSPTGIVMSWNAGAAKTFGYTQAEIIGRPFSIIFTAEDALAGAPTRELADALSGAETQHDRWHVRKDATRFWGTNTVQPLYDAAGVLVGFTKLVRDTTLSHLALEELNDSEQQLRLLIESVRDYAIFSLSPEGTIKSWNAGAQKVFGYTQAEIVGSNFSTLFTSDDVAAGAPRAELDRALADGFADDERWLLRKDGSRFLASGKLSQLMCDAAGEHRGFVKMAHDITESNAATQQLRRQAEYDELTQLPNRRMFYGHVARAIGSMKRRSSNLFAVLFIDLDHLKIVNDEFGHIVADALLAATARRLEKCLRSEDIVARIGGDEFAILLNGISGVADATDAAGRIGSEMRQPITIDGRTVIVTASVGIAIGTPAYERPEDILRDADTAMYLAKTQGRARAVLFETALVHHGRVDSDLSADLRYAVERGELRIAYQPLLRLHDCVVTGFEALVRWEHPRRGLLAPFAFISKAEETDLIVAVDRWMIRSAVSQLARWQSGGIGAGLHVSVNVSAKEFRDDGFLNDLRQILRSHDVPAARLRLEITESLVMERSERANALMAAIRSMGVELHVDDFGTGYSSLQALQHISVDALKIDASFVARITTRHGAQLVETVITLAHNLGLVAIAEGIESAEQHARLVALGCDYGQGFLFSAPLDADAAGRFVTVSSLARTAPG